MSDLIERFQRDLAEVSWKDLRIHLQRDALITVAPELDLVEVAGAVAADEKQQVERWLAAGCLGKPSAAELELWETQPDKPFRILIVQPFILLQEVSHA